MDAGNLATLVNLVGFLAGASLYAMLLVMVLGGPAHAVRILNSAISVPTMRLPADRLPLATAVLGLAWNVASLASDALSDLTNREPSPFLTAASLTALGFLPAVVVHSVLRSAPRRAWWLGAVAYGLSAVAACLHVAAALTGRPATSDGGLLLLTIGYSAVMVPLFVMARRSAGIGNAVWIAALAVFAVSGFHLSHDSGHESWLVELAGHHASIPLALAILYQDYRFALADLFLKRAITLVLLVALVFGVYLAAGARLLGAGPEPFAAGVLLGLWVATALAYPLLRGAAAWFVDTVVLGRADYGELRAAIGRELATVESVDEALEVACRRLAPALSAGIVRSRAAGPEDAAASDAFDAWDGAPLVRAARPERDTSVLVSVLVPATDAPQYLVEIGDLAGGRRLLSDDVQALEAVAYMVARRVDALRVSHERCVQSLREQEMSALATEAELRALRAQLNPHFLFNALTTIGYLIQVSPERALETLMRLTGLLRAVLKRSASEFTTLGDELDLVESYLAIERARLEERLRVRVDVPAELRDATIPLFALQPLVENAVKHGVAPAAAGGEVTIGARVERGAGGASLLLTVADSGLGATPEDMEAGRARGIGLASIERRLERHYGDAARLAIRTAPGGGTTVELRIPLASVPAAELAAAGREEA
jgi:signal transduction histidine kinase